MWMKSDGLQRSAACRLALFFVVVGVVGVVGAVGCKKKESAQESKPGVKVSKPPTEATVSNSSVVAKVHWLGKKRILADTNAATLAGIWKMPESEKLEGQTLDKLAIAPWHPWATNTAQTTNTAQSTNAAQTTNTAQITNYSAVVSNIAPALLLRPLLADLLQEESWFEGRKTGSNGMELAVAVRLDEEQATRWETNLTALKANGLGPASGQVQFQRIGDWMVVGYGQGSNGVFAEMTARFNTAQATNIVGMTNSWLEAEFDLGTVARALAPEAGLPANLPRITAKVNGNGKSVLTHANLDFPQPVPIEMEPWKIPTNLVHDPLIGFMAIRGIRPWLKSFKPWNDLQLGTPPNQAYFWAQAGAHFFHFAAFPSSEATNQVNKLTEVALHDVNPFITNNPVKLGAFVRLTNSPGIGWHGLPYAMPNLRSVYSDGKPFVFAGFFPYPPTNRPFPDLLLPQVYASTNILLYDWEITGDCLQGLGYITQLVRSLIRRPALTHAEGLAWLLALEPKLKNSASALKIVDPRTLSFSRNSTMGFTAIELELLADWLESPQFPRGLHTFLAPMPPARPKSGIPPPTANGTNAPSAAIPTPNR